MRLSERCYAVTGLAWSAPWFVNAGFVVGDERTLLVDTGGNAAAGLTVYGYALAARPENRLLALNTERHFDHIGGNGVLKERGVEIWGHADVLRTAAEFAAEIAEFNASIPDEIRRQRDEAEVFFGGTALTLPNHRIDRDMSFDLGGCEARIVLAPGHTASNICVWVPSESVLFSGDALVNGYAPNLASGGPSQWRVWLESLVSLRKLDPEIVLPGHGAVARGIEAARMFDDITQALETAIAGGIAPAPGEAKRA